MDQAAKEKVVRARASLILDQPFFGALALKMRPVEDLSIETFATNGRDLIYNPTFVNKISMGQMKTEVCHEVLHNVLDHIARRGARDPKRWNIACDYPINQTLKDLSMEMDDTYLLEPAFNGMTADHIYGILPPTPPGGGGGSGGGGKTPRTPSHIQDAAEPLSPKEVRDWKLATMQAANAAKAMGKLPGTLEKFLDNLLDAKVNWKDALRQFVTQSAEADYSWMRPNRMMLGAHGIYLPSLFSEAMKPVAVFKDISGSIDDVIQDAFNAEVRALVQDCRPEKTHVMYVDTRVARYDEFTPDDQIEMVNIRGGGTSFVPPFEKLEELDITPACAIYLTDMEGVFPEDPGYPVLWVSINKNAPQPPFGDMIHIDI